MLRGLGVGKSSFEDQIGTEAQELLKEMSAFNGKAFNPKSLFSSAIANVICLVVFGKRYLYDDREFKELLTSMSNVITSLGGGGALYAYIDLIGKLPFFKRKWQKLFAEFSRIHRFIQNVIDVHRAELDPHNLNNFVDVYLMEIKRNFSLDVSGESNCHSNSPNYSHLNVPGLELTVRDLFAAGSETTVTTLEWCLLYMALYPEIQQRVQAEIDAVVGRNRLPRLADKPGLNLTRAVIWEVQRMASIVPLGLPHVAASDTQLQGFLIPKGTILVSNMWRISRDPKLWPEPEKFKPERFLDDEGQSFKPEEFIPFGVGE